MNAGKFGLACGVTFAILMFLFGLVATYGGWGADMAMTISALYLGFSMTFIGVIIGAIWAFVEGFIVGYMVAYFYNMFSK